MVLLLLIFSCVSNCSSHFSKSVVFSGILAPALPIRLLLMRYIVLPFHPQNTIANRIASTVTTRILTSAYTFQDVSVLKSASINFRVISLARSIKIAKLNGIPGHVYRRLTPSRTHQTVYAKSSLINDEAYRYYFQ